MATNAENKGNLWFGILVAVACTFYVIISGFEVSLFTRGCEMLQGKVTDVSSGLGAPHATVAYTPKDGKPRTASYKMASKSGSKQYYVGEQVSVAYHKPTNKARKGSFLSLWFKPLLGLCGVGIGIGLFIQAKRSN